jgi:hypothetical protein
MLQNQSIFSNIFCTDEVPPLAEVSTLAFDNIVAEVITMNQTDHPQLSEYTRFILELINAYSSSNSECIKILFSDIDNTISPAIGCCSEVAELGRDQARELFDKLKVVGVVPVLITGSSYATPPHSGPSLQERIGNGLIPEAFSVLADQGGASILVKNQSGNLIESTHYQSYTAGVVRSFNHQLIIEKLTEAMLKINTSLPLTDIEKQALLYDDRLKPGSLDRVFFQPEVSQNLGKISLFFWASSSCMRLKITEMLNEDLPCSPHTLVAEDANFTNGSKTISNYNGPLQYCFDALALQGKAEAYLYIRDRIISPVVKALNTIFRESKSILTYAAGDAGNDLAFMQHSDIALIPHNAAPELIEAIPDLENFGVTVRHANEGFAAGSILTILD